MQILVEAAGIIGKGQRQRSDDRQAGLRRLMRQAVQVGKQTIAQPHVIAHDGERLAAEDPGFARAVAVHALCEQSRQNCAQRTYSRAEGIPRYAPMSLLHSAKPDSPADKPPRIVQARLSKSAAGSPDQQMG